VKKIISKTAGFTTDKNVTTKGYTIRLKLVKVVAANRQTKCDLSGELERFPESGSKTGGKGAEMVSTSLTGSATATGTSESSLLDCVEAVAESMVAKTLPAMRTDMTRR
jgi:hypothetical protein